jgi:LacI family transcriptional regulator
MNIRELARKAGTSYTTVSRALNNSPLVAEETRKRILALAGELGYQINDTARSLATGIRMTVGVMYPYHSLRRVESLYTTEVVHTLREELQVRGFDTMITGYDTVSEDLSSFTRLARQKKVDGLIVIGSEISQGAIEAVSQLADAVFLINPERDEWASKFPRVRIDDYYGGVLAGEQFLQRGISSVTVLMQEAPLFALRRKGFSDTISLGNPEAAISTIYLPEGSYETAYEFTRKQFGKLAESRGLFVIPDKSAFGVMNALQDNGVSIPRDIAIIGYDDVEGCLYCRPSLSTIHQPRSQAAVLAAQYMESAILRHDSGRHNYLLKPTYVQRSSC